MHLPWQRCFVLSQRESLRLLDSIQKEEEEVLATLLVSSALCTLCTVTKCSYRLLTSISEYILQEEQWLYGCGGGAAYPSIGKANVYFTALLLSPIHDLSICPSWHMRKHASCLLHPVSCILLVIKENLFETWSNANSFPFTLPTIRGM